MAIRSPDPHNLRSAAQKAFVIEVDRACPVCGYNLRGLRSGSNCPECGTVVARSPYEGIDQPLSLAPWRVIVAFIRGCWAASAILAATIALILLDRLTGWTAGWLHWALAPLSVLWLGAVAWLTPALDVAQAATRGFNRRSSLRKLARWLQSGWVLAAACVLILAEVRMSTMHGNLCRFAMGMGILTGIVGVVLLSILMERLAEWARDDLAETLFNWAMWSIPITSAALAVDLPLPIIGVIFTAIWLVGIGLFPIALISLSSSVTLSVVHNYEHRQRQERRAERQQRYDEQVHRTVQAMDAARSSRGHV